MGNIRTPINFEKLGKSACKTMEEYDKNPNKPREYIVKNGPNVRELLRKFESGECITVPDYPGGYEQMKKDIESGMYDDL